MLTRNTSGNNKKEKKRPEQDATMDTMSSGKADVPLSQNTMSISDIQYSDHSNYKNTNVRIR